LQQPKHQPDYVLYFTVLILTAIGVITVYSASSVYALNHHMAPSSFAVKQLIAAVLGGAILTVTMTWIPYQFWYKRAVPLTLFMTFLLIVVLVPGLGHSDLGSRRWFGGGSFHIQPSEIAVVFTVIYLAYFFTRKVMFLHDFKRGLRPAMIMVVVQFGLIMLEPDMGTSMTLLCSAITVIYASGARMKRLLIITAALIPAVIALALVSYRSARVTAWLHPFANVQGSSYQLLQGWTAIAAGGWFGRGFGQSIEKTGYLPIPQADFIFPIFAEEWGYFGAIALLVIFGVLIWRGFTIARYASDRFSALVAVGITSMIVVKTFINLGAVTGLLPVTGIPLPFISYGGTSLVVNMAAMGILLSISRHTRAEVVDSDDLADVIPIDAALEMDDEPGIRPKPAARRRPIAHASGGSRNQNKVTTLPQQSRKPVHTGGWRARQEAAATKSRERRRDWTPSRPPAPSWRDRNQKKDNRKPPKRGKSTNRDWRG
jgi:cell division protein FtsW